MRSAAHGHFRPCALLYAGAWPGEAVCLFLRRRRRLKGRFCIKGISLLCCAYKHSMAVYSVSRTTYVVVFSIGRAGVVVPARHTSKRKAPSERELSPKVTGGENLIFLFSPSVSAYIEPPPSQREALNTVPQKPKIQAIRPFDIEKNFTRERKITEWKNELFPSCWRW